MHHPFRRRTTLLVLLALIGIGCSQPSDDDRGLPDWPAEPTADGFTGTSYAAADGLPQIAEHAAPVWLLAIDGATWDLVTPMIERGELPNWGRLVDGGAHAVLQSERPTISPALWATIATGVPRFEHGVVNFLVRRPGRYNTTSAGPPDRRSPALWELVGAAGGSSDVISWFGSYPAEKISGRYVSKGFDPVDPDPRRVHPTELLDDLTGIDIALDEEDSAAIARTEFLSNTLIEDVTTLAVLERMLEQSSPDLLAVYLSGIDVVQHVTWRHMAPDRHAFPEDGPADSRLADVIPAYYRFIDRALGRILDLAPEGTTFVLLSDHGAGPMRLEEAYHLQLEVLLERVGLMNGEQGTALAIGEMYRHEKRIWLNLEGVEATGTVALEDAPAVVDELEQRLVAMRTDSDEPVFAEIGRDIDRPDWRPGDPALTVRFSPVALLATHVVDQGEKIDFAPVRLRHTDVSGGHRPDGMLVLNGPAVRPGRLQQPANLYNIAPTVLHLLGLPQDRRMLRWAPPAGGVLTIALDPGWLADHPVTMVAEYPGTDRSALLRVQTDTDTTTPDPDHDERMERLRSLGYIR